MADRFIISIVFMFLCSVSSAQPVKKYGQLKISGTQLTDQSGRAVSLHGMSFGWHNWWPRFYNKTAVKWLAKDWNCTVVRAAMGIEPRKGFLDDPQGSMALMQAVIDAAIELNIYVIIDWHSHNIQLEEAKKFFAEMARHYGKNPHVIYEIFNEPDKESWPEVKAYSEEVIRVIREIDPDNIILVGSPDWDQAIHLPAADPIKGYTNLMYAVHFYAGTHKQWLRDRTDEAIKKGLPVFVSECAGMEASGNGPIDHGEWMKWVSWMDQRGLSWLGWSIADKQETCSVLNPTAASEGNWIDADVKEWGKIARDLLRNYKY